jgi:hypothetical protein
MSLFLLKIFGEPMLRLDFARTVPLVRRCASRIWSALCPS